QDELRPQCQRARDLETAQQAKRQIAGNLVRMIAKSRPLQDGARLVVERAAMITAERAEESGAETRANAGEHVLHDGELAKPPHDLKRAADPEPGNPIGRKVVNVLLLEPDLPAAASHRAAEQVEERRLAGTVRPDHAEDFARRDIDAHIAD